MGIYSSWKKTIVIDDSGKEWIIGKSVGKDGCGNVFFASDVIEKLVPADTSYVIKMDILCNTLLEEVKIYFKLWIHELVESCKNEGGPKNIGIPQIFGSGRCSFLGKKVDFMVMERLGCDLNCVEKDNRLTVGEVGVQLLTILENIHNRGYIHGDLKPENIMCGYKTENRNQIYLLGFGKAKRYLDFIGSHCEHQVNDFDFLDDVMEDEDEIFSYNGTSQFSSFEACLYNHSRKNDIESLAYIIITWTGGRLPWIDILRQKYRVADMKRQMLKQIPLFLETCYPNGIPAGISNFLAQFASLNFEDRPNYLLLKNILRNEMKKTFFPIKFIDETSSQDISSFKKWRANVFKNYFVPSSVFLCDKCTNIKMSILNLVQVNRGNFFIMFICGLSFIVIYLLSKYF